MSHAAMWWAMQGAAYTQVKTLEQWQCLSFATLRVASKKGKAGSKGLERPLLQKKTAEPQIHALAANEHAKLSLKLMFRALEAAHF
jgi:hypothetical protein